MTHRPTACAIRPPQHRCRQENGSDANKEQSRRPLAAAGRRGRIRRVDAGTRSAPERREDHGERREESSRPQSDPKHPHILSHHHQGGRQAAVGRSNGWRPWHARGEERREPDAARARRPWRDRFIAGRRRAGQCRTQYLHHQLRQHLPALCGQGRAGGPHPGGGCSANAASDLQGVSRISAPRPQGPLERPGSSRWRVCSLGHRRLLHELMGAPGPLRISRSQSPAYPHATSDTHPEPGNSTKRSSRVAIKVAPVSALQRKTASARRLHYWRVDNAIELSRVVNHEDMTPWLPRV